MRVHVSARVRVFSGSDMCLLLILFSPLHSTCSSKPLYLTSSEKRSVWASSVRVPGLPCQRRSLQQHGLMTGQRCQPYLRLLLQPRRCPLAQPRRVSAYSLVPHPLRGRAGPHRDPFSVPPKPPPVHKRSGRLIKPFVLGTPRFGRVVP